jgi:hypothetical protein
MTELAEPIWSVADSDDLPSTYLGLIRLLHNIGFMGCILSQNESSPNGQYVVDDPAIYNHDDPTFPDHLANLRLVSAFVVHPAFRIALDIQNDGVRRR